MATLNSQQYINIQCTTYKQIQNTIEQMELCAPCSNDCLMKEPEVKNFINSVNSTCGEKNYKNLR